MIWVVYLKLKSLFGIMYCLGSCSVSASTIPHLPRHANVPGGVAIISLDIESSNPPQVHYQQMRTMVMPDPERTNRWLTVVGIPLDAKPGTHSIQISSNTGLLNSQNFTVRTKTYSKQKLTLRDKRKVQPLEEDLSLIEQQYIETIETYAKWQYQPLHSAVLALPLKGRTSSPFGLTRIMNNIPQNPHSGLDIAAPKGAPVYASKAGTVINIGNYFYSGNIVFIDHGQGFITSYCHLDTITVSKGQTVQQREILGTVGSTGRATGAHLHWSVSLNGVRVDPQWFVYE